MLGKQLRRGASKTTRAEEPPFARISLWLQPREIVLDVEGHSREQVLHAAADVIGRGNGLPPEPIYDALLRREQAGSTALTDGFAIPHARIPGIARPLTLFLRTRMPIGFGASDGRPVSSFLVIMVPTDGANDDHLQLLAMVAKLFTDRRFRKDIGVASDAIAAARAFTTGIERVLTP